jgi:hypothetical protein
MGRERAMTLCTIEPVANALRLNEADRDCIRSVVDAHPLNAAAEALLSLDHPERLCANALWRLFRLPEMRELYAEWEALARLSLAIFRRSLGRDPLNPEGAAHPDGVGGRSGFQGDVGPARGLLRRHRR